MEDWRDSCNCRHRRRLGILPRNDIPLGDKRLGEDKQGKERRLTAFAGKGDDYELLLLAGASTEMALGRIGHSVSPADEKTLKEKGNKRKRGIPCPYCWPYSQTGICTLPFPGCH